MYCRQMLRSAVVHFSHLNLTYLQAEVNFTEAEEGNRNKERLAALFNRFSSFRL